MIIKKIKSAVRSLNNKRNQIRLLKQKCKILKYGFLFSGRGQYFTASGYEPFQTDLIIRLFQHISKFINVGAHHGYYCCLALSRNIPTIAFEPHPMNVAMLKKHLNANAFPAPMTLIEAAVGSRESRLNLYGAGFTGSLINIHPNASIDECQEVDVVTLNDKVNLERGKALFLIDVEGFELEVLRGATKLMADKPYWVVEILPFHENQTLFSEVFSFMSSYGYNAWGINESSKELMAISLEEAKRIETKLEKTECTNFIFAHEDDNLIHKLESSKRGNF